MNLNLNAAECLRDVANFGYSRIYNVCRGGWVDVPWGTMAWLGVFVLAAIVVLPVALYVWLEWPRWRYSRTRAAR